MPHRTTAELEAALGDVASAPRDRGTVDLVVRRPAVGEREPVDAAELDPAHGVVGDSWLARGGRSGETPHPGTQITLMNSRFAALIAGDESRWPLAGDQLYVDLDLSEDHLPPGTRLEAGTAVLEIAEIPHLGCDKFVERFGLDAMKFVNSPTGRAMHLRGIYARVVTPGHVRRGDVIRRLPAQSS